MDNLGRRSNVEDDPTERRPVERGARFRKPASEVRAAFLDPVSASHQRRRKNVAHDPRLHSLIEETADGKASMLPN